jgi:hypothetical protein
MKKEVSKNVLQTIISNVLRVINPVILRTTEFQTFLRNLMIEFGLTKNLKTLEDEIWKSNRQDILEDYGLGMIGEVQSYQDTLYSKPIAKETCRIQIRS